MDTALKLDRVKGWLRVEFRYKARDPLESGFYEDADPSSYVQSIKLTDRETDDDDWEACPSMTVKFPLRTGGFNEQTLDINLPRSEFTDLISVGEPFPRIRVRVVEFRDNGDEGEQDVMFDGFALMSTRNPNGKFNRVLIRASNLKSQLKLPLGIPALPTCVWTFMGNGCGVVVPFGGTSGKRIVRGLVSAVSDKTATIVADYSGSAPWSGAENDRLYTRGFVVKDGIRVGVRDWHAPTNSTTFHMLRKLPSSWEGAYVLLIPGCDKALATCRDRWDNEERFGGLGIGIPAYNPLIENPAT